MKKGLWTLGLAVLLAQPVWAQCGSHARAKTLSSVTFPASFPGSWTWVGMWDATAGVWAAGRDELAPSEFGFSGFVSGQWYWIGVWDYAGGRWAFGDWYCAIREDEEFGEYLVIDLSAGPSASGYPVSYLDSVPAGGWSDEYKTTKMVLRFIPSGTFAMGSPTNEVGRSVNETQRQVTLTKDYYIGVFEVTQGQWERIMGDWPSTFNNTAHRDSRPVEEVSYYEIREDPDNTAISPNWPESSQVHENSFMGKLRAKTGFSTLDLPTEAQWEHACRAGTTTALNTGYNLTNMEFDPRMDEAGRYREALAEPLASPAYGGRHEGFCK